jgi:two-component system, OmpR family, sensor histidine kinase CiaH
MFHSARLKLTIWYIGIIACICWLFSGAIYQVLIREVERFDRAQRQQIGRSLGQDTLMAETNLAITSDLVGEVKHRILVMLIFVNAGILGIVGVLSYILAGKTLLPIKDMVEEQNRFITDASHELKTPLTSLRTAFEVHLRDKKHTLKDADTVIRDSLTEVNNLQLMSESLLLLAQYQKSNGHTSLEPLSLNQAMEESMNRVKPLAKKKSIKLALTIKTEINVEANRYGLVELLVILLDNAIKYSPAKSTITLTGAKHRNSVTISVKDQGIGISKNDQAHIFDRFFRSDQARHKEKIAGGYGLGLAIAQKIVTAYHGSITVTSKLGQGSVFTITLPTTSVR